MLNMGFDEHNEILFSSFLAGSLLFNRSVSMIDLSKSMHDFSMRYNLDISDHGNDFNGLIKFVDFKGNFIELKYDYDAEFQIGDNIVTMYDYLYGFTTIEVREYFGIPEKEDVIIYEPNNVKVKKHSILSRFKRTKVYV